MRILLGFFMLTVLIGCGGPADNPAPGISFTKRVGVPQPPLAPGTIIQPIQFCPGVTPVYPSSFPESGVCIEGSVYGVYSANGGFLAELPPGTYNSNGINASCSFTIGPDCAVN